MARLTFEEDIVYIRAVCVEKVHQRTHNTKRYVFQIDLEWSNGSYSSSFRSYNDFFEFQCELLDFFPMEAGKEKGSERVIPFLPGKKLFRFSTFNLAMERMAQINDFTQKLIALPENISHSDLVLSFFRSNWPEDRLRSRKHGTLQKDGQTSVKYSVQKDSLYYDSPSPDPPIPPHGIITTDQRSPENGSSHQDWESGRHLSTNDSSQALLPQETNTQRTHKDDSSKEIPPQDTNKDEHT